MTHEHSVSLISSGLSSHDSDDDISIRPWLAGSFAFHFLLIVFLTTLRFSPTLEKPLHSYEVSLINLSDLAAPQAAPTKKTVAPTRKRPARKSVKRPVRKARPAPPPKAKTRPPEPKAKPLPPLPTQSSSERLSESFAGAVESVVIPNKLTAPTRQTKVDPIESETIPTDTQNFSESIKLPKSAPQLARANRLTPQPRVSIPDAPAAPKQTQAQEAPPSTTQPSPSKPKLREETQKALQAIKSPPEAPTLTPIQPFRRTERKDTPTPKVEKLSETLKQTIQSVKVPKPRTSVSKRKKTARSNAPTPKVPPTQERLTPEAPQLAQVTPSQRQTPPPPVKQERLADSLKQVLDTVKIPKLRRSTSSETPKPKKSRPKRKSTPTTPQVTEAQASEAKPSKLKSEIDQQLAKLKIPDVVPIESIKKRLQVQAVSSGESSSSPAKPSRSSEGQNRYLALVEAKIDQHWVAPPVSMDQRHMKVMVKFRILRSGEVMNLTIKQGSGNAYYDSAAKRAVKAASPLPPFPNDLSDSFLDVLYKFSLGELTS